MTDTAAVPTDPEASPNAHLEISVVIPTWNRGRRLRSTLDSMSIQTLPHDRFEVVVVDDGSEDDTAEVVRTFATDHPDLHLRYVHRTNGGVNAARNSGVDASVGEAVSFLDDDEVAPADHLERISALLHEHPRVAGVGGPYLATGAQRFRTCPSCSIGDASLPVEGRAMTQRLLGGNMTMRREVFEDVGLFDAEISGRGDENEWFHRAARDFLYDEDLFIWHRRDDFSLHELCRTGFRQGTAIPLLHRKSGDAGWRPSLSKIPRLLTHAVVQRCSNGLVLASREAGTLFAWCRLALSDRLRRGRARGRG